MPAAMADDRRMIGNRVVEIGAREAAPAFELLVVIHEAFDPKARRRLGGFGAHRGFDFVDRPEADNRSVDLLNRVRMRMRVDEPRKDEETAPVDRSSLRANQPFNLGVRSDREYE